MKKNVYILLILLSSATFVYSQKVSGKLKFIQGQNIQIVMETKTTIAQEAMGQMIDFNVDGTVTHSYSITNETEDNSTLNHKMQHISFMFDGMGRKINFNSDNPKDMNGQFGKPVKDVLEKNYNMIIDPSGKVMMAIPEKIETSNGDDRLMIVTNMLKDILGVVQPPKKGAASFFKVLPETEVGKGDSWSDTTATESLKEIMNYTLTDITDSVLVVGFRGNSTSVAKAEFMGMETTTNLSNTTTGTIIIDRVTNIIREKNSVTDSKGTTEAMGGTVPVTSKMTVTIKVNPSK